jgi:protein O-mannosyl-transferase
MLLLSLLLAVAIALVYWPVTRLKFINFDDPDYVTGNLRVQAGLTAESIKWAFTSLYASNWHPLTWLSHMLDCQLYNLKPAGHHLTSLLLHIVNSLLLLGLLQRLTGALWRSAAVAALFALHPLHVESVAWVSERKDVLSAFFFMLTLWAYVQYATRDQRWAAKPRSQILESTSNIQHPTSNIQSQTHGTPRSEAILHLPSFIFYLLSLGLFALGLMSKPMLVTLPFVLLLLDYWPLQRFERKTQSQELKGVLRLLVEKAPFFLLSAASCVLTFLVQRACGAMTPLAKSPLELRVANALVSYARYLGKTIWPAKLAVLYPYERFSLDSWQVAGAALLLVAVTAGVVWVRRQRPYLLVGWLWFVGMLVPVIGLVQVGKQSLADRYTYLPHIGLFIAIVWGVADLLVRLPQRRWLPAAVAALVLAACGLGTARQLSYWRDTWTLFQRTASVTSGNFVAYAVIANDLVERGNLPQAIEWCRRSLDIAPDYPEANNTLGNIYTRQERYDEALACFRAAEADRTFADPRVGAGNVLIKQGKFVEAEATCREALSIAPLHLPALFCLATALHGQGKLDEAGDYYRRILALNPNLFTPHRYLGNICVAQGKPDEAISQFKSALKIRPEDSDTRTVLGVVLLEKSRTDEAFAEFQEAARLQTTNVLANYHLALIYQSRKDLPAAIERFRRVLSLQPDWPESLNNLAWILAANPDASVRNGPEAVSLAERACKLTDYKAPLLVGTLAAAYAEAGRFPEAVSSAEKARALALAAGQTEIVRKNEELLKLYRAGRPYHEGE